MAYADNNIISLSVSEGSPYIEGFVSGLVGIQPGYIVELQDDGTYQVPATDPGDPVDRLFAVENQYGWLLGIEGTYTTGTRMFMRHCRAGDIILAFIVSLTDVSIGDFLTYSGANGRLDIAGAGDDVLGVSLESFIGGSGEQRIKIEVN